MDEETALERSPRVDRLRRNLQVWGAIGVSIGLMGPSMAANINPQAPAGQVGRAVPLVFLLSTIGVLLVAYGFIRLTQYFNHAGSVYGFVGVTLGPRLGFVAGWTLLGTYIAYAATTVTGVGLFGSTFLDATGIWHGANWVPITLIALAVVWWLASVDARAAVRSLLTLEGSTVALILIVTVVVFVKLISGNAPGGNRFSMSVFTLPTGSNVSSLFFAITFGFLSFAGFEAASTLGEECENPRRAIPFALLGTVLFAGLFFTVVTMAEAMGFGTGPKGVAAFTSSGSLMGDLGRSYIAGWVGNLVTLGAAASAFGSALASVVGASRLLFAFGRDGFITTRLGMTSTKSGAPIVSAAVITILVALQIVGFRIFSTTLAIDVFFWTATMGTLALLITYLLATLGAIRLLFLSGVRRVAEWQAVIPVAAIIFVLYVLYKNVYPVPAAPYNRFPYVVAAWILIGLAVVSLVPGLANRLGRRLAQEDGLVDTSQTLRRPEQEAAESTPVTPGPRL